METIRIHLIYIYIYVDLGSLEQALNSKPSAIIRGEQSIVRRGKKDKNKIKQQ